MKKDKKIYVVTDGAYSDYHICGVFSSRYRARKATKKLGGDIDVWPLDTVDNNLLGLNVYVVTMSIEGDTILCEGRDLEWDTYDWATSADISNDSNIKLHTWVLAHDEKHAIKIANERRTRAIAEGKIPK